MSNIIPLNQISAEDRLRNKIVFELDRISNLIKTDQMDPQVEYLLLVFKQGDDIIVGGSGVIPGEDRKEIVTTLNEAFDKFEKPLAEVEDINNGS